MFFCFSSSGPLSHCQCSRTKGCKKEKRIRKGAESFKVLIYVLLATIFNILLFAFDLNKFICIYINQICKSLLKNFYTIISTLAGMSAHFALLLKSIIAVWKNNEEKYLQAVVSKLLLQVIN